MIWLKLVACRQYTDLYSDIVSRWVIIPSWKQTAVRYCNKPCKPVLSSYSKRKQLRVTLLLLLLRPRKTSRIYIFFKTTEMTHFSPFFQTGSKRWFPAFSADLLGSSSADCSLFRPLRTSPFTAPRLQWRSSPASCSCSREAGRENTGEASDVIRKLTPRYVDTAEAIKELISSAALKMNWSSF